jgi:L-ascorbate 6-phosphate lactonase
MPRYNFTRNDPYDRQAKIELVLPPLMSSSAYMQSIRQFEVPSDGLAIWYLGQNGFILKSSSGPLIGIDLYLTDSCAAMMGNLPFRVNRQLPIFIEPEDLDVDVFFTTHSHDDHADPDTIRRFGAAFRAQFFGPWESVEKYRRLGMPSSSCRVIHPNQTFQLEGPIELRGTFALPTDNTDLNHMGLLARFSNGITFYNSGDTAYCNLLDGLLPRGIDICSICINGGFHNLDPLQAASIVKAVDPEVVIPCHYDMMIHNVEQPERLRTSLECLGSKVQVHIMDYYRPWVFRKAQPQR